MRVALKYCGGCDPAYERAEYFQCIRQAAGGSVTWCRPEEADWQVMLLVCGCAKACPRQELPAGWPVVCVSDADAPPEEVVRRLQEKASQSCR